LKPRPAAIEITDINATYLKRGNSMERLAGATLADTGTMTACSPPRSSGTIEDRQDQQIAWKKSPGAWAI
jgi:dTDP-glucose pyrophosphorylase